MLIVGAGGFGKELSEIVYQKKETSSLAFYDDMKPGIIPLLFGKFPILKNEKAARDYFVSCENAFTTGIGSLVLRYNLYMKFISCACSLPL